MKNSSPNKIEIALDSGNAQDQIFLKMYSLIESDDKKSIIKKALAYYLTHGDELELEEEFGDGLKEAKTLAKIKMIRTEILRGNKEEQ